MNARLRMYKYCYSNLGTIYAQGLLLRSPYSITKYLLLLLIVAGKYFPKWRIYKLFAAKSGVNQPT